MGVFAYLLISLLFACMAHMIRIFRWEFFIKIYEQSPRKTLVKSLAIGYFINFFIPFKLEDVVRAFIAGRKMKNGKGFALATVIIERFLDIIFIGIVFGVFYVLDSSSTGTDRKIFVDYCFVAIALTIVILFAVFMKEYVKKAINALSGMFNEHIEEKLLRFFWSLVWGGKNVVYHINKLKLISLTILMWGLYGISYWFFAYFIGTDDWKTVFYSLFDVNALFIQQLGITSRSLWYTVYLILPSVVLLIIGLLIRTKDSNLEGVQVFFLGIFSA